MAERAAEVLESYRGREKIMRLIQYSSYLISGGLPQGNLATKFLTIADAMGECRTVLRLFDDLAMFSFTRSFGLGKKEKDGIVRWTSLLDNIVNQTFYPSEHLAWAIDKKLLRGRSDGLWYMGCYCWVMSLVLSVIRDCWLLVKLHHQGNKHSKEHNAKSTAEDEHSGRPESQNHQYNESQRSQDLKSRLHHTLSLRRHLILSIVANVCDLSNGVHWSTPGFLWAGKLPLKIVGLLGTVSSICLLFNYLNPVSALPSDCSLNL